jgi:hypothetical protein
MVCALLDWNHLLRHSTCGVRPVLGAIAVALSRALHRGRDGLGAAARPAAGTRGRDRILEDPHPCLQLRLVLVALSTGIICLNAVFQFEGLRIATDSAYAAAFGTAGSNSLVLLLLDTQHYGTLSAQVFFGLWLVPLGYLAKKSRLFPSWLGVVLVLAGVCYLVDLLAAFLVPDFGRKIHAIVVIPSAIAEIAMVLYLLVVGVRTVTPDEQVATEPRALVGVAATNGTERTLTPTTAAEQA